MTKKHFEAIAKRINARVIRAEETESNREKFVILVSLDMLITEMIYDFEQFNPNFDRGTFRKATGIDEAMKVYI